MKLAWWARIAAAFISAAYWSGSLAVFLLLIVLFYPNRQQDNVESGFLVAAGLPYFCLYGVGFLLGLLRKPSKPNLWAVYPAALQIPWMVPGFFGDFIFPLIIWGPLAIAVITLAAGHMLKALFHPARPASEFPGL